MAVTYMVGEERRMKRHHCLGAAHKPYLRPRKEENQDLLHPHHKPTTYREKPSAAQDVALNCRGNRTLLMPHKAQKRSNPRLETLHVCGALKRTTLTAKLHPAQE